MTNSVVAFEGVRCYRVYSCYLDDNGDREVRVTYVTCLYEELCRILDSLVASYGDSLVHLCYAYQYTVEPNLIDSYEVYFKVDDKKSEV